MDGKELKRSSSSSGHHSSSAVTIDVGKKCKTRTIDLCSYSAKFGNETVFESERVVPTGPNPLHNR